MNNVGGVFRKCRHVCAPFACVQNIGKLIHVNFYVRTRRATTAQLHHVFHPISAAQSLRGILLVEFEFFYFIEVDFYVIGCACRNPPNRNNGYVRSIWSRKKQVWARIAPRRNVIIRPNSCAIVLQCFAQQQNMLGIRPPFFDVMNEIANCHWVSLHAVSKLFVKLLNIHNFGSKTAALHRRSIVSVSLRNVRTHETGARDDDVIAPVGYQIRENGVLNLGNWLNGIFWN